MDTVQEARMVLVDEGPDGHLLHTTPCTRNWKAAQSDNRKGVFIRWDQTGILFVVTDMQRSGEL